MPAILIGLAILLGAGGTVVVADDAKPGDALFGVDRAVENIRLNLANEERKKELKVRFAEERINELEEILDEDDDGDSVETENESADDDSSADEADENQNEDIDDEKKENISTGIGFALDLLGEVDQDESVENLIDRLNALIDEVPEGTELSIKISDSGSSFIKVRSEDDNNRFDFEIKETGGGKTVIKTRDGENKVDVRIEGDRFEAEVKPDNRGPGSANSGRDDDNEDDSDEDEADEHDDEVKGIVSSVDLATGEVTLASGFVFVVNSDTTIEGDLTSLSAVSASDIEVEVEAELTKDGDTSIATKVKFETDSDSDSDDEKDEEDESNDDSDDDKEEDDDDSSDNSGSGSN